jgi:general secretion pathway protein F
MAAFRYEAASDTGKITKGMLDADGPRQVRAQLREKGLTPITVQAVDTGSSRTAGAADQGGRQTSGRLSSTELSLATRQMASLLVARLPLEQALSVVAEQAENLVVRERFAAVRAEVLGGHSFADALSRFPRDFPEIYRGLVAAGEQSGDLAVVMGRLADHEESRTALKSKVLLAFTYPAIVTFVAISVIIGLLTYVVPQVVGVFAQTKQKLPFLTVSLIAISDFLRHYGIYILGLLAVIIIAWRLALRDPTIRLAWDSAMLRVPLAGRLIRGFNTSRFSSTLAILTASGVPLLKALDAGAATLSNVALRENVDDAISRVREGAPLARALAAHKQFPPMLVHMVASGEATGKLPEMLERAAVAQAQEVERRTLMLTSLLEPLLILTMGLIVLLIVLAVLLPIIEINQLVR